MHFVKNARSSYAAFLENEKNEQQQTTKRKLQNEAVDLQKKKAKLDLSAIADKIIAEECKLQAAHNILNNGQEILNAALNAPTFLKIKVIEANNLLQLGTDKIKTIECIIKDLKTQKEEHLISMSKKLKLA